jgi:hypothetical protein
VHPANPLIIPGREFSRLPSFCFPRGFDKFADTRTKETMRDYFIFEVGRDPERRVFGMSVIFSFAHAKNSFLFNERTKSYPFCFCFLTTVLAPSAQFRYLDFLGKWLGGQILTFVNRRFQPLPSAGLCDHIPGMVKAGPAFRIEGIKIPRVLNHEISFLRTLETDPTKDRPLLLSKGKAIWIPSQITLPNCLLYFTLDVLFSVLPVPTIVQLVSIFLLEKRMVFLSNSVRVLSLCLMCLRELLRPFKYVGIFLPVLPLTDDFIPILDSPTPFVCGIGRSRNLPPIPDEIVLVDLDRAEIRDPDASPCLAGSHELISKIDAILALHLAEISLPPRLIQVKGSPPATNPDFIEFIKKERHGFSRPFSYGNAEVKYLFGQTIVEQIANLFRCQIEPALEALTRPCFITDTTHPDQAVTVFNRDVFLQSIAPDQKEFYAGFMHTTMFQQYLDGLMDENARNFDSLPRESSSPLLSAVMDSSIESIDFTQGESGSDSG